MGHDIIIFGEEEIDITEDNTSEDESVWEWNDQDYEDKTADTRDNAYDVIEELEDDKVVRTPTDNDVNYDNGQNIIEGEASDDDMSQGVDLSDMSSPSEEETQDNNEDPNLVSSGHDRKTPSP